MVSPARLLSIGEFAAATQLSPKALRLYDEQHLLTPARTDAANGYRYYRHDQIHRGRLIRTLRDVGIALTDIAAVLAAEETRAHGMLAQLGREQDQRYAREKRALHTALLMLGRSQSAAVPAVTQRTQDAASIAVRPFTADRHTFIERFRAERAAIGQSLARAKLAAIGPARCALIDPLTDDETRLEVVAPIATPDGLREGVTFRQLPAAPCAVVVMDGGRVHASELAAATDTLFDWFDRFGHRALGSPLVSLDDPGAGLRAEIAWAFEPARE